MGFFRPMSITEISEHSEVLLGRRMSPNSVSKVLGNGVEKLIKRLAESLEVNEWEAAKTLMECSFFPPEELWPTIPRRYKIHLARLAARDRGVDEEIVIDYFLRAFKEDSMGRRRRSTGGSSRVKHRKPVGMKMLPCKYCGEEVNVSITSEEVICSHCLMGLNWEQREMLYEGGGSILGSRRYHEMSKEAENIRKETDEDGQKRQKRRSRGRRKVVESFEAPDSVELEVLDYMKKGRPVGAESLVKCLCKLDGLPLGLLVPLAEEDLYYEISLSHLGDNRIRVSFKKSSVPTEYSDLYRHSKRSFGHSMVIYHIGRSLREQGIPGQLVISMVKEG